MKPLYFVRIVWILLALGICAFGFANTTFAASGTAARPTESVADGATDPPRGNPEADKGSKANPTRANRPDQLQATLQATDTITAGNGIYTVHIINVREGMGVGLYTATTGPDHPAGPGLNVLFGDGTPFSTFNTVHSYTTGADYVQHSSAVTTTKPITLDRFGVVTPIGATGFRTTYDLAGTPDQLTIVSEVNVQGTTREDSAIDVRTIVTDNGAAPVRIGVRYLWDFQIGADDGPTFQAVNPDSSVALTKETTFLTPSFESYQIVDNDKNPTPPTFVVFGTVTGPPTLTPTQPDLLQYACWPEASDTAFTYAATVTRTVAVGTEECLGAGGDSAVLYYFGADEAHAITIQPGESYTVAAALFATEPPQYSLELTPLTAVNDVGAQHTVTATVTDEQERLIQGQQVLFTVSGANTATCLTAPLTDSNGQTTCTYTGNNVGEDRIIGWIEQNGNNLRDPIEPSDLVTKTWTPVYTVTLTPITATRDVGAQHTVTATVVDHQGNPVPGLDVDFIIEGANTATCFDAPPTDSNGQTSCTYTGENTGGDSITAWVDETDNDLLDPDEFFGAARVNWTPVYTITLSPTTAVRDVGTIHEITASVVDHKNRPVSNLLLSFQVTGVNSFPQVIPTLDGRAVFTYLGQNNESGDDAITAWIEANGNNLPDPSEFRAAATVTWRRISIHMEGRGVGDARSVTRTITATVENDEGGAARGVTVAFEVTGGTPYGPATQATGVQGQAVFTYTSTAPEARLGAAETRQVAAAQQDTITVWVELSGDSAIRLDPGEPRVSIGVVTAVTLITFESQPNDDGTITLLWETAAEIDNAGFNLYRATAVDGPYVKIHDQPIPGQGTGSGAHYSYVDAPPAGNHFYYKLEDVDYYGLGVYHGPIEIWLGEDSAGRQEQIYLPIVQQ